MANKYENAHLNVKQMQADIAADQGEVIWRQDLAALGERIFDLDMYAHGPQADKNQQGVALRQLHLIDTPAKHELSQPDSGHYTVTSDGLRLRLKPEETSKTAYSTSEWAPGPCRHMDQYALVKGMLDGDPRVIFPGRAITWRLRLSQEYADGTARGTFGMIAQDFRGHEDPHKKNYNYTVISMAYVGPDGGLFTRLLSGGGKPRMAMIAADYTLGNIWVKPLPADLDVTGWHDYTLSWDLSKASFLVDGKEVGRFEQGGRAFNLRLMQGKLGLPFTRGFLLPGPCQPDAWVDNNTASSPTISGYCKFDVEQWAEIASVETRRLPVKTWCVDGSREWPYYTAE